VRIDDLRGSLRRAGDLLKSRLRLRRGVRHLAVASACQHHDQTLNRRVSGKVLIDDLIDILG
jgi:hypothetical protein